MTEISELMKNVAKGKASQAAIEKLHRELTSRPEFLEEFNGEIAFRASKFGYFKWPVQIHKYLQGMHVLDVGCGSGMHGIGCLALGAESYLGVDPGVKLDKDEVKNKNAKKVGGQTPKEPFGWTPRDIIRSFGSRLNIVKGTTGDISDVRREGKFDVILMYTVTEHLMDIDAVFRECSQLLRPNGKVLFLHDNFYSWNGHHMRPKSVADINLNDPEQLRYLDWNHLRFEPPAGHYFHRGLNKIRLDDLKKVTENYFIIDAWEEVFNDYGRLSDEIVLRYPQFSRRELSVSKVFCVASDRNYQGDGK